MTYRSSGVVNLATGSIALYAAYVYAFLRQGKLLTLIPFLPKTIDVGSEWSFLPATLVALAMAALLGLLLYALVFRPLRRVAPLAKAVASLGVSVVLTGVMLVRLGTEAIPSSPIFPSSKYKIGSIKISADRIWFAVTVLIVAGLLAGMMRFTRFGLHTRAAASSEKGAYLSGISPDRVAMANWMLSAAVAGLAGILISPILPLVPAAYTLFIVPALAAAIVGRFQYAGTAVVVGLAIGMIQSDLVFIRSKHLWLPSSGLADLVPLLVIIVMLVVRSQPLPGRGALAEQQSLGRAPRPRHILTNGLACGAIAVVALALLDGRWRAGLSTSLIFGLIGISVVVVTGYSGQISLAVLVTAGASAFSLGPIADRLHIPFPLAPLVAAVVATVVGVVVCLPALRIRGLPVAVVTLALAVSIESLWFRNNQWVKSSGVDIHGPKLFGFDLRPGTGAAFPRMAFCVTVVIALVLVSAGVGRLRTSRLGSALLAVRANERSAAASGINVLQVKVAAFAISAFIAGLGGALLAYQQGNVTFQSFDAILGLSVFATVYIAGVTSITGGVLSGVLGIGGILYVFTHEWLHLSGDWYQVATGIGLVLTVVKNPEGIAGSIQQRFEDRRVRKMQSSQTKVLRGTTEPRPASHGELGPPIFSVSHVGVRYGGVHALVDVSFDVRQGSITGLIGPNGAGKTTLMDAITGFAPASGTVHLNDIDLSQLPPHGRVAAGLGRTFQALELWNDMTVGENVLVGLAAPANRDLDAQDEQRRVLQLLDIDDLADRPVAQLSQGQRQLVSVARALVGRPKLLLLDEPAGGLDSAESAWLGDRLRDVRDSGVTILLVDHDMSLVLNVCDEIKVLDIGSLIATGAPGEIRRSEAVARAYLGSSHGG